jgi:hypothetical protein
MRIGGQDHLGHTGHSMLVTFTSHLEAVGCSRLFGPDVPPPCKT